MVNLSQKFQPTKNASKVINISDNLWFFKNCWISKVMLDTGVRWAAYAKYEKGGLKDKQLSASGIKSLMASLSVFTEEYDVPIISDMAKESNE